MKEIVLSVVAMIAVFAIIGGSIWWEASLFFECRETNSFFYCMRVLAK